MRVANYELEVRLRARHRWSHFRIHRENYYTHVVWGRLSVIFGQPHLEPILVCSDCYEAIDTLSAGDESWSYCESCHQVEGSTEEITTEEYERRHA